MSEPANKTAGVEIRLEDGLNTLERCIDEISLSILTAALDVNGLSDPDSSACKEGMDQLNKVKTRINRLQEKILNVNKIVHIQERDELPFY